MTHPLDRFKRLTALGFAMLAVAAMSIAVAATSGNAAAPNAKTAATKKLTSLKLVSLIGLATNSKLQLGIDKGFWKKQGIDLQIEYTSSPQTAVPRVVSGDANLLAITYGSLPSAMSRGLPIVVLAPIDTAPTGKRDIVEIVTPKSSGIKSVKQLEGKTVGVNSLGGSAELQVRIAAKNAGIDPKSIKYVPLPFPTVPAALRAGTVDAAIMGATELATQQGSYITLSKTNPTIAKALPYLGVITSKDWLSKNRALARSFQLGMLATMKYIRHHRNAERKYLPKATGIPKRLAGRVTLTEPALKHGVLKVQQISDALRDYGLTRTAPKVAPGLITYPLPKN